MSADAEAMEDHGVPPPPPAGSRSSTSAHDREEDAPEPAGDGGAADADEEEDEANDEDDEDDEPKLKYAKLTDSLSGVYRNGDSTSTTTVAGDKMVLGTHNGIVHVLGLPSLRGLRSYRGHNATVTSISVSPTPPPPTTVKTADGRTEILTAPAAHGRASSARSEQAREGPKNTTGAQKQQRQREQQQVVPNTPANQVYIATSSLDGHVCIQSLVDPKDVQLRNFARPVQAVALSPDYKSDRTYLSGGKAGQLILTVGGKAGVSADANTNSAAAAASGWLGSIGLGTNTGRDTLLHSGEGAIHSIKWSLTGKWVVWVNEEGIKIMRSHLKLGSEDAEDTWRRIAHAAKPNRRGWQDMAGVWRARCEWVDEQCLEPDDLASAEAGPTNGVVNGANGTATTAASHRPARKVEKLVVGWGDTAWILHVQPGMGYSAHSGQKQVGTADIMHKLHFTDCVVSGISLYTPSLLAVLAYRTRDDDDRPISGSADATIKGGRQRHKRTGLAPELRLIDVKDGAEIDVYELPMSRFEMLSAQDYHLSSLFMPQPLPADKPLREQKGALEAAWQAAGGGYASRLFSSSASVMSGSSSGKDERGVIKNSVASPRSSLKGLSVGVPSQRTAAEETAHPFILEPGLKLWIQSAYDCVLAVKRELADHLKWLLEQERYGEAWTLIDKHPEVVDSSAEDRRSHSSQPPTPSRANQDSLAEFFADTDSQTSLSAFAHHQHHQDSAAAKEKQQIGNLWLQQLVARNDWTEAGRVAGKVLGTSGRWEHWVWTFAQADKFNEITPYIPSTTAGGGEQYGEAKALPSVVYEVVLGHYIIAGRPRLKELLETWDPELFDVRSVITAIEDQLQSGEVSEESVEGGEPGRDWRILVDALAKLYLADGRPRDALRCYIQTQDADAAMNLIREEKLMDAIDPRDIPGLILLRITKEQLTTAELGELEEGSAEPLGLLVEEALKGRVTPGTVIRQLERRGPTMQPFVFFYLRALWRGPATGHEDHKPRRKFDRRIDEGHALVEDHADLAVSLFAEYDRELLMTFLRASSLYSYEKAANVCEQRHYIPELVYILSKTGQTRRALSLIIGELGDVSQAISFAKENGELWDDLLDYSMNKPRFIRGLLEEVGTAIDPVKMVRRIPQGLEIEGLKEGIQKLVREYEIQYSISKGVAKVLGGEVASGLDTLRAGQKKAVRFEVVHETPMEVDLVVHDVPPQPDTGEETKLDAKSEVETKEAQPGHCVGCGAVFHEDEKEPLVGFACGHVYHLSCLLRAEPDADNEAIIERLLNQVGRAARDEPGGGGRSVGAKVAHAHIIKNVVKGGCRHCNVSEDA